PRPPLGSEQEPIRWREQHVVGLAPLPSLRDVPSTTGLLLVALFALSLSGGLLLVSVPAPQWTLEELEDLSHRINPRSTNVAFLIQAAGAVVVFSLLVGIRCSGAVSGEREQQTWEALLVTPLDTRAMLDGKLWGVMRAALPYLAAWAVPALL